MPSFAIHTVCGIELLKKLKVDDNSKRDFIIGNILPDVSRVRDYKNKDDLDKRKSIQDRKMITHFRVDDDIVLQYPDLNKFLDKYEGSVKKNIISLAYFFHLYTDYYYFKIFLNDILCFYDKDMNITNSKKNVYYVKILRNNEVYEFKKLFNKLGNDSIYNDYSISNKYLINKYNLNIDYDDLIEYIDQEGFTTEIKESNSLFAYYAIIKLRKYLKDLEIVDDKLRYFTYEEFDSLVENIINNFIKDYGYLLDNYR